MSDAEAWENNLIAGLRANDWQVTEGPLAGHPLLVMTATGAKSGEPRRTILTYSRDGDAYVAAGTNGGSPTDPLWLNNLRANPDVTVEVSNRTFQARAEMIVGADRERLWDAHAAALPWFAPYPAKSRRTIPMVRLVPLD
ncbi:MAG: nitroreductase/quinone reductase family protein [Candidatus Limnocylindrales bacterium]